MVHPVDEALDALVGLLVDYVRGHSHAAVLEAVQSAAATLSLPRLELLSALERLEDSSGDQPTLARQIAETLWRNGLRGDVITEELVRRDPANIAMRAVWQRHGEFRPLTAEGLAGVVHIAYFVPGRGNLGDRVLPGAVRRVFGLEDPQCSSKHVHQHFSAHEASILTRDTTVIVGGGGLILPDTRPNARSGWQWNIDDHTIEQIGRRCRSFAVFAIGVNLFAESEMLSRRAIGSLTTLASAADVIGLRNHGSIERLRAVLPGDLHHKLVYTPCPTVLGPDPSHPAPFPVSFSAETIGINCAYDRADRRFSDLAVFEHEMVRFCESSVKRGRQIRILAFHERDVRLSEVLVDRGVPHRLDVLFAKPLEQVYETLCAVDVVAAMRGHAQMIPFGLGVPFITIDSHPKTRYFATDAGMADFTVRADSESLSGELDDAIDGIGQHWDGVRSVLEQSRNTMAAALDTAVTAVGLSDDHS